MQDIAPPQKAGVCLQATRGMGPCPAGTPSQSALLKVAENLFEKRRVKIIGKVK